MDCRKENTTKTTIGIREFKRHPCGLRKESQEENALGLYFLEQLESGFIKPDLQKKKEWRRSNEKENKSGNERGRGCSL